MINELYAKQILINNEIGKKFMQCIFNTICFSEEKELQLTSAI